MEEHLPPIMPNVTDSCLFSDSSSNSISTLINQLPHLKFTLTLKASSPPFLNSPSGPLTEIHPS